MDSDCVNFGLITQFPSGNRSFVIVDVDVVVDVVVDGDGDVNEFSRKKPSHVAVAVAVAVKVNDHVNVNDHVETGISGRELPSHSSCDRRSGGAGRPGC
jgi:hypothetical protein